MTPAWTAIWKCLITISRFWCLSKGKRRYTRKKELVDAITQTKKGELEAAREAFTFFFLFPRVYE